MPGRTIPELFEESVKKYSNNVLMRQKDKDYYSVTTYSQMRELVYKFSGGLIQLGLRKGDRAALISEGRNDWVMSELAILYSGAVNVPISVKIDELNDLKFRLTHSGCKLVIVSGRQFEKIKKIKSDLPELEKIIVLDKIDNLANDEITKEDVFSLGKKYFEQYGEKFDSIWKSVEENDYANICYTSGTTADPKGIILTHRNYTANVEQSSSLLPVPEWYSSLLILPWDHAFAHTAGIYTLIKNGASMASVQIGNTPLETLKNIPVNIIETKPVFLLSVPALAKNFRKNIEKGIKGKGEKIYRLFQHALKTAYEINGDGFNKPAGMKTLMKKPLLKFYDKLLFSKIRENFGGKLEFFIGGGALLDIELQKFFYAIGIPMFQGYGLTETAPVISANVPNCHKLGSSGKLVENLELKICDEKGSTLPVGQKGEIVVKGENVMAGYWKNPDATDESIRDGWLYTGDLGYLDEDGFLYVLGRSKSLLIANDGEKYSPEGIEEAIVENSPYIDQVMLYNNQSPYTVALVVPNKDELIKHAEANKLDIKTEYGQESILSLIQNEIEKFKEGGEFAGMFPERWLPSAVAVLGEGFTEENKFMNSTLKMVRGKITEFYKSRIDYLLSPEGKIISNHQNKIIISRLKS